MLSDDLSTNTEAACQHQPLLSICIPTYNRVGLLVGAVNALLEEIKSMGREVEIVVCDNASTDNTAKEMSNYAGNLNFRFYRNEENLGATCNIMRLVRKLAAGKFTWVLGDDDLVIEGAVRKIIEALKAHPEIDYFFINHTYKPIRERAGMSSTIKSSNFDDLGASLCSNSENRIVAKCEEIIRFSNTPALFTSIVCHLARTSLWRAVSIDTSSSSLFDSFDTTFPHIALLAPSFVGRPAYYFGQPQVILFVGAQEWLEEHWSRLIFTHVLEISHFFERFGADKELSFLYRDIIFRETRQNFRSLMDGNKSSLWKLRLNLKLLFTYSQHSSLRQLLKGEAILRTRHIARRIRNILTLKRVRGRR